MLKWLPRAWMMINISYEDLRSPGNLKKNPISPCFKKEGGCVMYLKINNVVEIEQNLAFM